MLIRIIPVFLGLIFVTCTAFGDKAKLYSCIGLLHLVEARELVHSKIAHLSPNLNSVRDMRDILDSAEDTESLENTLRTHSRAQRWGGSAAQKMSMEQLIDSSLITHQTGFNRFNEDEKLFLRKALSGKLNPRILSMPASVGAEPVTLSQYFQMGGMKNFNIYAFEKEALLVDKAKTGTLELSNGESYIIPRNIRNHLHFEVFDIFKNRLTDKYDLIVTRNFLHYFKPEVGADLVGKLVDALNPGGLLMVDDKVTLENPEIFRRADLVQLPGLSVFRKN